MDNANINIWWTFKASTVIRFGNITKSQKFINNLQLNIKYRKNYNSKSLKKLMFHLSKLFFTIGRKLKLNLLIKCLILTNLLIYEKKNFYEFITEK